MKIGLTTVLTMVSVSLIPGCNLGSLSDDQILSKATRYAMARGINLQDYDISLAPSGQSRGEAVSLGGSVNRPDFSKNFQAMAGSDTRAVVFSPRERGLGGAFTFYINKHTGKLVVVSKQK